MVRCGHEYPPTAPAPILPGEVTMSQKIAEITVASDRARPVNTEAVTRLAASMAEVGQLQPIIIDDKSILIAGAHRMAAAKLLGWTEIDAVIRLSQAVPRRIIEIDENLIRYELTALEKAEHLALRQEYFEKRHAGPVRHKGGRRRKGDTTQAFSAVMAGKLGQSRRQVQRQVAMVGRLGRGIRQAIVSLPLADNAIELERLSRLSPDDQIRVTEALLRGRAKSVRQAQKALIAARIEASDARLPTGPYRCIVMDPPWHYGKRLSDVTGRGKVNYPTMTQDDLLSMHDDLTRLAHDDGCVLWLWTTNAHMGQAHELARAWGFEVKTILTWIKPSIGCGDWLRGQTEHCLLCVSGHPLVTLSGQSTVLRGARREHSRKPGEFYTLVESLCPGSKLEMFSRASRDGWASWGGEVGKLDG
jgi:N6-adenosine-specific RNA methylase IME4